MSDVPGADASDAEIIEFYKSDERWGVILAGLYVGPFAGMALSLVARQQPHDGGPRR
jgi:hypothetical protein